MGSAGPNVATLATPPGPATTERTIWSVEDVASFLNATKADRLHALWLLAVTTGLRRGELAGLHWPDVDLDSSRLTVSGARVSVGYKVVESAPKTAKGRRTIAVAPVVEVLRAHRRRQLEERLAWGPAWVDTGLVSAAGAGAPTTQSTRPKPSSQPHVGPACPPCPPARSCHRWLAGRCRPRHYVPPPRPQLHQGHGRHLLPRGRRAGQGRGRADRWAASRRPQGQLT